MPFERLTVFVEFMNETKAEMGQIQGIAEALTG
jgi:hypothetical protein